MNKDAQRTSLNIKRLGGTYDFGQPQSPNARAHTSVEEKLHFAKKRSVTEQPWKEPWRQLWYEDCFNWREGITIKRMVPMESSAEGPKYPKNMDVLVESMFIRKYFTQDARPVADEMMKLVRETFHRVVHHSSWMDEATKINATKKLDAMRQTIGYPEQLLNQTVIDGYFKSKLSTYLLDWCYFRRSQII